VDHDAGEKMKDEIMTTGSTSARNRIDLGFAVLVAWIGTFLAWAYHGI
jgi:hypothetical protein